MSIQDLDNKLSNSQKNSNFIIIYQPDQTISMALYHLITSNRITESPFQTDIIHFFDENNFSTIRDQLITSDFHSGSYIDKRKKFAALLQKREKINFFYICCFREPVAWTISLIFQHLNTFNLDGKLINKHGEIHQTTLRKIFFEQIAKKTSFLNLWLQSDITYHFNIQDAQLPFDKEKGIGITHSPAGPILVTKYEAFGENFSIALKEMTGLNVAATSTLFLKEETQYSDLYNDVEADFRLPKSFLDALYQQPYIQHFYTESEIDSFKRKWQSTQNQQEYQEYWRQRLAEANIFFPSTNSDFSNLIIIAGLPRSGSTLLYNIVLQIIERSGKGIDLGYIDPKEVKNFSNIYDEHPIPALIKVHAWHPLFIKYINSGAKVIFSYRDLRDSLVSALAKGFVENKEQNILDFISSNILMSQSWEQATTLLKIKYEDTVFEVHSLIMNVLNFLNINISAEEIDEIARDVSYEAAVKASNALKTPVSLNNGKTVFDVKTQLHINHLSGGKIGKYLDELPKDLIFTIEEMCYHWLFFHGYETSHYEPELQKKYYGENGEDYILWKFFDFKRNGFFIDVGAFDGRYLNNSLSFEESGWKGICAEADPQYFQLLKNNRPKSNVHQIVLINSEQIDTTDYFIEPGGLYSSLNPYRYQCHHKGAGYYPQQPKTKISLPATTLTNLLNQHLMSDQEIDFLSISVAGDEIEVLKGLDLRCYKPRIILIQTCNLNAQHLLDFMNLNGYLFAIDSNSYHFYTRRIEDIEKLRGISTNCTIEKQSHPKGIMFTSREYCEGRMIVDGYEARPIINEIKKVLDKMSVNSNEEPSQSKTLIEKLNSNIAGLKKEMHKQEKEIQSIQKLLLQYEMRVLAYLELIQENTGIHVHDMSVKKLNLPH